MKNDFFCFAEQKTNRDRRPPHHPAVPVLEQEPTEHAKIILYLFDK